MASSKKKNVTETAKEEGLASTNNPLFFVTPHILDAKRHAKSTLTANEDYRFSKDSNSVPVNGIEFIEAAKYYPIVFSGREDILPAAVLGFEQTNSLIDAAGKWRAGFYVPAYVRQYPFIFFEDPNHERFYLCVDEGSANFSLEGKKDGIAIYNNDGTTAPLGERALEYCTAFYQHHLITINFCSDLVKHDLLVPFQSEAKLANGRTLQINNFKIIDEKKFNELPDNVFAEFRKMGWLPFVYLSLASNSNWKRLLEFVQ